MHPKLPSSAETGPFRPSKLLMFRALEKTGLKFYSSLTTELSPATLAVRLTRAERKKEPGPQRDGSRRAVRQHDSECFLHRATCSGLMEA